MVISLVVNLDNRVGYKEPQSTVGDYGVGSLQGVRTIDFLTDGLVNKISFFRGHEIQCIAYIDKHSEIEPELMRQIEDIVYSCGNNSKIVLKPHDRTAYKWNDRIYIEALKMAEGDFVAHLDQDTAMFRKDDCDIVDAYIDLLERYKYICQPWDGVGDRMYHASTRFFICKRETLNFPLIEQSLHSPLLGRHNPCLEFTLSILAGEDSVLYPPREDGEYIVFSWAKYFKGTLRKLNEMPYSKVRLYVFGEDCTFAGANDVLQHKRIEL